MRGFARILLYFFTWRSVITGAVAVGAALLVLALNALLLSPYTAFSIALLAFVFLLVLPYLSAPIALRQMISSRSLAIIPYFALKAGFALLMLTVLLAGFLPLIGWLLDLAFINLWFGLLLFIIASLYTLATQLILPSKHSVIIFSLLPIGIVTLLNLSGDSLATLARDGDVVATVAAVVWLGWAYCLWVLTRQQAFAPAAQPADTALTQNHTLKSAGSFAGWDLEGKLSAVGSLLFAYPASLPLRLINLGSYVLFFPLLSVGIMMLTTAGEPGALVVSHLQTFLLTSLFCGCISCYAFGEIGARARLLWLRLPGQRSNLWHKLERELWLNFFVLGAFALLIALAARLIEPTQEYLPHYVLILVAFASYDSYLNLCARLFQWPSVVQAIVMIASIGTVVAAIYFSVRFPEPGVLVVLEIAMLLLTLALRQSAKWRFNSVDWLVLKHAISKRVAQT